MYICILMCSDIFASGLLFTETTKELPYDGFLLLLEKWAKCKYFHSQIIPLDEGLLRTRISSINK